MLETLTVKDSVELAVLERSGFVESRHIGAAVVVRGGRALKELGDSSALIYPRSSLKPIQTVATMRAGVPLAGAQVALSSASHVGTPWHVEVAAGMLKAAGLTERNLLCPAVWPVDEVAHHAAVRSGGQATPLAMTCSGKHAGYLWACVENGWPLDSYLEPSHPLQKHVMSVVEEFTGDTVRHVGVDGCGAPVPAITLAGLARGIARLSAAPADKNADARAATVATMILDWPEALDGPGHPNTTVIEELDIIAKSGVEGLLVLGARDGTAVAVKILDGNGRAALLVGLSLMASVGSIDMGRTREVLPRVTESVTGKGAVVGSLRLSSAVLAALD